MAGETECDGWMIGRGALGNPWIFAEIKAALCGRAYQAPTSEERLEMALAHAADMVARKGERVGIPEARKHMVWYCKGLRGAAAARGALMQADTVEGIKAVFADLLAQNE
jgi:tRNA-dihydrouridine synthase